MTASATVLATPAQAALMTHGATRHVTAAGAAGTAVEAGGTTSSTPRPGDPAGGVVSGDAPDDGALLGVDPTDPRIGRLRPPSAPERVPASAGGAVPRSTSPDHPTTLALPPTTLTLPFKTSNYGLFEIPAAFRPYAGARAPRVDTKPHDSAGVRKVLVRGRLYDHPVAQAQWGIANVNSYLATKDTFYLDRAKANAQQIIASRVAVQTSEGVAWFFKYPFDFNLHSGTAFTEVAPWYSGMAQGLAISLFTRLVEADPGWAAHWRTAAYGGYRAFLVRPTSTAPWVVHADSGGYLWLDEYPIGPRPGQADLTLNGHMFAMFGLYDYYLLTGSAGAKRLFDGSATTVMRYIETSFRTVNWLSRYCLAHVVRDVKYHGVHVAQLRLVFRMTHAGGLARESERLDMDYPGAKTSGTVSFPKGTVTGYRFDANGAVVASRSLVLSAASSAPAGSRTRIKGRGIYLTISAGALQGYAVAEVPGRVYLRGVATLGVWAPPDRTFAYTTSSQLYGPAPRASVVPGEVAHTDRIVLIGGRLWYHVVDGRNAGRYVRYGTVTTDVSAIEG